MQVAVSLSRAWAAWIRPKDFEHCSSIVPRHCWLHAYFASNRGHRAVIDAHILAEMYNLNYIIVVLLSVIARPSHRAKNNWWMDHMGTFPHATETDRHVGEPCGRYQEVSVLFCRWLKNCIQLTTAINWRSFGSFSANAIWIIDVSMVRHHISSISASSFYDSDETKTKNRKFAETYSLHSPETQLTGNEVGKMLQYGIYTIRRIFIKSLLKMPRYKTIKFELHITIHHTMESIVIVYLWCLQLRSERDNMK